MPEYEWPKILFATWFPQFLTLKGDRIPPSVLGGKWCAEQIQLEGTMKAEFTNEK